MKTLFTFICLLLVFINLTDARRHHGHSKHHSRSNKNQNSQNNQGKNQDWRNQKPSRGKPKAPKEYEYNALTLSWLGEFCSHSATSCKPGWNNGTLWDGKTFTIHGFWPQYNHEYDGRDPNCKTYSVSSLDLQSLFSDDSQML